MFTGIVEEIGTVKSINSNFISISASKIFDDIKLGDSIAVNGVCLTVTRFDKNTFDADVSNETLRRTNFGQLKSGSKVNLERAMPINGRFGGHIVSGHIDDTGIIKSIKKDNGFLTLEISAKENIMRYIIEKGSVTIDGISLTIANLYDKSFDIAVIIHTIKETILQYKREGDIVNIENDVIGKYVERLLFKQDNIHNIKKNKIDMNFLLKNGF